MIEVPRRRRGRTATELTPLIDVVFQLLVFFLLTTTFALPAVPLELPGAESARERREADTLVLSITEDGRLFIGDTPLPEDELELVVRERLSAPPYERVLIRGDIGARYGLFMRVLDACRLAGARRVLLETEAGD